MTLPKLLLVLLASVLPSTTTAFIWWIDNEYPVGQYKYTFSELYMFSAQDTAVKGDSFIDMDLRVDVAAVATQNVRTVLTVFRE